MGGEGQHIASAALQVAQSISRDNPIRYDHTMSTNAKNPAGNELHNTTSVDRNFANSSHDTTA